jgi:Tol biopolymer transport system component
VPSLLAPLPVFNPALPPSDSAGGASQAMTSADGRFTVYTSTAPNLVPGQAATAVASNVFLYDRQAGTTTLVSHTAASATTGADGSSQNPQISSDGHFIVYESTADDLVAGQAGPHGQDNVFLYDATTGRNTLVSHEAGSPSTAANGSSTTQDTTGFGSGGSSAQPSGQFLLFSSYATDLVSGQAGPGALNLFLYDTGTGAITLVSHDAVSPVTGANAATRAADLTPDGSAVVYQSYASDLVPGQTGGNTSNIFLYDRGTGTSQLISGTLVGPGNSPTAGAGSSFQPLINADGHMISYLSGASDLVAGQTASAAPPGGGNGFSNVFRYDTHLGTTTLVSGVNGSASETSDAPATEAVVSSDGSTIAFLSEADDLVPGQVPSRGNNVFVYSTATGALTLASHAAGAPLTSAGFVVFPQSFFPGANDSYTWDVETQGGFVVLPVAGSAFGDVSVSADGRFVSYQSGADNLVTGQLPGLADNVFLYDGLSGQNTLVSHVDGSAATRGDHDSLSSRVSADGSTVVFLSLATDLDPGVSVADGGQNLFTYDLAAGAGPTLASRSAFQATATTVVVGTSADGRFVLFTSNAPAVVPGQVNGNADQNVFLFDRDTGTTTLVSHAAGSPTTTGDFGSPSTLAGGLLAAAPVISADGNWVAFFSAADDLAPAMKHAHTRRLNRLFLFNRLTGAIGLVSSGDAGASTPVLSADGRFLAYASRSTDLVSGFTAPQPDVPGGSLALVSNVYLYDTTTGTTTLVSHAAGSTQVGGENPSFAPVISDDGRFVAYQSEATALVAGGTISPTDNVYLFDHTTGSNSLVSHTASSTTTSAAGASTTPAFSADGSAVAFVSPATDLVPGQQSTPFTNVFVYSVAGGTVSLASGVNGSPTSPAGGFSDSLVVSVDGSAVAFRSGAPDLVAGQVNTPGTASNVFLFNRQAGAVTLLSHAADSATTTAAGDSSAPAIDGAGDLVVYLSTATNLVPGQQGGGVNNIFLYSGPLGENALLSGQGGSPVTAGSRAVFLPLISRDPVAVFNAFAGGGGTSVGFINRLVELVLSSSAVADGSQPGTVVGTVSVVSALVGQFLPPVYRLPAAEADNASFGLGATAQAQVPLVIEVPANAAARASYQVVVHVNIGLGDDATVFTVSVGPRGNGGITAGLVSVKTGKKKKARLMVQVFSAATGALLEQFLSPFQKPAFKNIEVRTADSNGDGVADEVVVSARKGRKTVTATFPG